MKIKIYQYKNCSTCKNAIKFLEAKGIPYDSFPIVDQPPSYSELAEMLNYLKKKGLGLKQLFNTSGQMYRELNISEKLASMTEDDALKILAKNGKLIKRPFVLLPKDGLVGFKESDWKNHFD